MSCCSIFKELLATAFRDSFVIISNSKPFVNTFFKLFSSFLKFFSKSFRSSQLSARLQPSVLCLTSSACLVYTTASPLSTPFFKVFPLFLTFYLFVIITQLGYPPIVHFTHIHIKYAKKRASQCARLSILHYYIGQVNYFA